MAFGRNMLYPFSRQVDWQQLLNRKQAIIDQANIKENSKRRSFDYKVCDLILKLNKKNHVLIQHKIKVVMHLQIINKALIFQNLYQ